jgi:Common central domain of tyrosinase
MRIFVSVIAIVVAFSLFGPAVSTASAQEIRYRKHVDDMTPEEWKTLAAAITAMRQRDDLSTTPSPVNQATDSYEWFVKMHGDNNGSFGCEHSSELIWTWHRAFLLNFETVVNASRPAGTKPIRLPYWDWTDPPSGSNGFPAAYEDSASALSHLRNPHPAVPGKPKVPPLDTVIQTPHQTGKQLINHLVQLNEWGQFGGTAKSGADEGAPGELELKVHNGIHSPYIGKDNRNTVLSVRDPVFWAHHTMLDKVVTDWQAQHLTAVQCFDCDTVVYRDPQVGELKVSALLKNDRLPIAGNQTIKVVYLPKGAPEPTPDALAQVSAMAIAAPAGAQEITRFRFRLTETAGSQFIVRLNGLSVPSEESYAVTIYIYPAGVKFSRAAAFTSRYTASRFSQFATGKHHAGAITARIDVTSAIRAQKQASAKQEWEMAIVFSSTEPGQSYAQVAPTIRYDSVDLQRRDFATTETIPLSREKNQ